ncbi:MAG: SHOCT domain-containing protein [Thermoproteota archaeon]|nr:SHOCT domain-containing protein [Thermoproteota archaeon]
MNRGKLSDDDVLKAKNAIPNNIGDAKSALSISIVDKLTKLAKLLDEGAISSEDFLKAKENLLNKIKDL